MTPSEYFTATLGRRELPAPDRERRLRYESASIASCGAPTSRTARARYPYTTEALRVAFAACPPPRCDQMLGDDAADVYGFDFDELRTIGDRVGPTVDEVKYRSPGAPRRLHLQRLRPRRHRACLVAAWSTSRGSSRSTTTSSSRRTCGRPAPGEVPRRGPHGRARAASQRDVPRRQPGVHARAATGPLDRLVGLRGPRVPPTSCSTRARASRADEVDGRADRPTTRCARLLRPDGPPRRHGPQPRRGVAVLPDVPALLRPDVPRGAATRTSRCCASQAYNDWMVEEWCGELRRPARPAVPRSRCGTPSSPRPRCAATRRAACAPSRFCELPAEPRAAVDPRRRRPLGPVLRRVRRDRHRHLHAHRLGSKMPSTSRRRAAGGRLDAHVHQRRWRRSPTGCSPGVLARYPNLTSAYSRGPDRLDPLRPRAGRPCWEHNRGWGGVPTSVARAAEHLLPRARLRLLLRRRRRPRARSTPSASTSVTFETDYPHADCTWPHTKQGRRGAVRPPRPTTRSTRSCAATPSGCCGSTRPLRRYLKRNLNRICGKKGRSAHARSPGSGVP